VNGNGHGKSTIYRLFSQLYVNLKKIDDFPLTSMITGGCTSNKEWEYSPANDHSGSSLQFPMLPMAKDPARHHRFPHPPAARLHHEILYIYIVYITSMVSIASKNGVWP